MARDSDHRHELDGPSSRFSHVRVVQYTILVAF